MSISVWGGNPALRYTISTLARKHLAWLSCVHIAKDTVPYVEPLSAGMTALCNLQVQITDQPLTSLEIMDTGRICAVGAADGSTTIVQFSDGLVDLQPNEKQALTSVSTSFYQMYLTTITCWHDVAHAIPG